jgi:hypothetical protein
LQEDWFKIDIPSTEGRLSISLEQIVTLNKIKIEVLDSKHNVVYSSEDVYPVINWDIEVKDIDPSQIYGTSYFVRISSADVNSKGSKYDLWWDFKRKEKIGLKLSSHVAQFYSFSLDSVPQIKYILQKSTDLLKWTNDGSWKTGNGAPLIWLRAKEAHDRPVYWRVDSKTLRYD